MSWPRPPSPWPRTLAEGRGQEPCSPCADDEDEEEDDDDDDENSDDRDNNDRDDNDDDIDDGGPPDKDVGKPLGPCIASFAFSLASTKCGSRVLNSRWPTRRTTFEARGATARRVTVEASMRR